jgi:uracil-DNA glycosylase family 4
MAKVKTHPREVIDRDCYDCSLWMDRKQVVWGSGDPEAEVCFVGEAPGKNENEKGEAFVGQAGKLLRTIIKALKIKKFIFLNAVRCRPPQNRKPKDKEIAACRKYLKRQLKCLPNLKVVVALGHTAWLGLLYRDESVVHNHGKVVKKGDRFYLLAYHPGYVNRNKGLLLEPYIKDLKKVRRLLKRYGDKA